MEQVGSNDQVNIVVQWASLSTGKAVRMLIQKSIDPSRVTSPILQDMGTVDMGDYHSLQDFIQWGIQNYPAQHYFINVWNHGSGWHGRAIKNAMMPKKESHNVLDISWDDMTGNSITTEQLGMTMAYAAQVIGHKVDIYGSDACLMAMAEVANEMSDSVSYFVGSQELEPAAGWPYTELLTRWQAIPNATADQVSKILVDAYVKSYEGETGEDVTFSAYDLSKLPALDQAMTDLGTKIRQLNATDKAKLLNAANQTQKFSFSDYVDLLDFMKKLSTSDVRLDSIDIQNVQTAANLLIIANADTKFYANATGLSFWLPTDHAIYDKNSLRYQGLKFNAATQWGNTLDFLLQGVSK